MRLVFLYSLWFLVGLNPLFPQTFQLKSYSVENGLPSSEVYAICQDKTGVLWIGTASGLIAYDGKSFENFTISDGLSSNIIFSIFEDSKKQLWIGTSRGISKKNNVFLNKKISFVDISKKAAITPHRITSIIENPEHEILFGTAGPHEAIWIYNYSKENSFRFLSFKDGLLSDKVSSLFLDIDSNIWVGYFKGGVSILRHKKVYHKTNFNENKIQGTVWNIYQDIKKNIWLATDNGVYRFSAVEFTSQNNFNANIFKPSILAGYKIRKSFEDESNNLWFASNNGVFYHQKSKNAENLLFNLLHILPANGLSANSFWSATKDSEGNIWFGSFGGGINKFSGFTFINYSKKDGLKNEQIQCINEDHFSRLIIGTEKGVFLYKNKDYLFDSVSIENLNLPGVSDNIIYDVIKDSADKLFIATYGNGIQILSQSKNKITHTTKLTKKEGIVSDKIFKLFIGKNKTLWCATPEGVSRIVFNNGSLRFYDIDTIINYSKFRINRTYSIIEDQNQNIWGGNHFGITCLAYNQVTKKYIPKNIDLGTQINNNIVYSLIEDQRGNIWAGVYGVGLVLLPDALKNKEPPLYRLFSNVDGLDYLNINSLIFDNDSNLWAGSVNGIIKFDYFLYIKKNKVKFTSYGYREGFLGIECKPNAVYKDPAGKLWYGTSKGITIYNGKYDKKNKIEPILNFRSIKIQHQNMGYKNFSFKTNDNDMNTELLFQENHLTFEFVGVCLSIPEKVLYQYKLEGLDFKWLPPTSENKVTYSNLQPGKYNFLVKACNNDGIWNKTPLNFSFTISPPYWETWWFYTIQFSFFAFLVGASFKAGHSTTNTRIATILIFICIFILFEYIRTLLEPYFVSIIGGAPIFKVILNLILAVILFPIEKIIRTYLKGRKINEDLI